MKEIFRIKEGENIIKVEVIAINPKVVLLIVTDKAVYTEDFKE